MEWVDRLNEAIRYTESHLMEEIDLAQLTKITCCSAYHFQRMFTYLAGLPYSEYVRRRRMSLAAVDLQNGERVLTVALRYGYASPTAFNRAFQSVHGVAPSSIRKSGTLLKAYPPISFKITVKGAQEMEYRIEKKEAFRVLGISQPMDKETEKNFETVPQLWNKAAMDGTIPRLAGLMEGPPHGILGVCGCGNQEDWKYYIAVASSQPVQEGLEAYTVPAFTWAVFPGEGACPQAIQELERRIVTDWLPTSGYLYDDGPDIELYLAPDPQNARFEVWIPVVKQ